MRRLFGIGVAGFFGSLARYFFSVGVNRFFVAGFPYGTLAVNVTGSFIMGLLMGIGVRHFLLPESWRIILGVGFLGAFTTFSAFSYDTVRLMGEGHWKWVGLNIFFNLFGCLLATALGLSLDRLFVAKL